MKITDKIHKIKEYRLNPADRFLYSIFFNLKEYYSAKYPNSVFYKKDNEILFEYDKKNGKFWCHYYKIWSVLESNYGLNKQEIKELIKDMAWKTLKLKEVTPSYIFNIFIFRAWKTLKLKEVTPPSVQFHIFLLAWKTLKLKEVTPRGRIRRLLC